MLNYLQPRTQKVAKGREQEFPPLVTNGEPNPAMVEKFLELRINAKGKTLRDQFKPEINLHPGGVMEFMAKDFDESKLPTRSYGPHWYGGPPEWKDYYHGLKMEALYSIVADWTDPKGGLKALGTKTRAIVTTLKRKESTSTRKRICTK